LVAGALLIAAMFKSSQFPLTALFARSMEVIHNQFFVFTVFTETEFLFNIGANSNFCSWLRWIVCSRWRCIVGKHNTTLVSIHVG
jgi:hypothetical protein